MKDTIYNHDIFDHSDKYIEIGYNIATVLDIEVYKLLVFHD